MRRYLWLMFFYLNGVVNLSAEVGHWFDIFLEWLIHPNCSSFGEGC